MNELETSKLKEALKTSLVFWAPSYMEDAIQVISISKRNDEPSLCANLVNNKYIALYNVVLSNFVFAKRFE